MKLLTKFLALITIAVLFNNCNSVSTPQSLMNLSEAKILVQNYYETGAFDAECKQIFDDAITQIEKIKLSDSSAVIFDIDETALSNYDLTKEIGFGFRPDIWDAWLQKAAAKAIPQTKKFYDWLVSKNIRVIFLTGRSEKEREATAKNLYKEGYTKYDTLIVRSPDEKKIPAAEFKAGKRTQLTRKGYKIIACIGDQWSDLVGGNAGIKIKLPNYLYIID
ncbi:MAG: HAD family acid phosphatase [Ignavibacteriales bacterium]|nr:HAD family acid phosphatase [Ignavibacteriales bacterium]